MLLYDGMIETIENFKKDSETEFNESTVSNKIQYNVNKKISPIANL